eukprot:CAMPEP_0172415092 /NCGR_PEP_ID=MMETSP1064-20121228/1617_1 /TAXON_ID=202472 /ORGANISM="Aulacoseira subarctica , Strain CCAP 1002/5" /LENGTH=235 /DNA_ID=CAMNT_0013151991 /DNA_START=164 /DNA_END=871 /DNA_ORIENTATION=-
MWGTYGALVDILPVVFQYVGNENDVYRGAARVCRLWLQAANSKNYWREVAVARLPPGFEKPPDAASTKEFVLQWLQERERLHPDNWAVHRSLSIEEQPIGCDPHPEIIRCYVSSYYWGSLSQMIPIDHRLDSLRLRLCFAARADQDVVFHIRIQSFPSRTFIYNESFDQDAGNEWRRLQRIISIRNMPTQDSAIQFEWLGKDTRVWAGHYGAKVANISLSFVRNPEILQNRIDMM